MEVIDDYTETLKNNSRFRETYELKDSVESLRSILVRV